MRHIPIATVKDNLAEYAAAAARGDEIIVTRHGKPYMKLAPLSSDSLSRQREAVAELSALGDRIRGEGRGVPLEQIVAWVDEDRR